MSLLRASISLITSLVVLIWLTTPGMAQPEQPARPPTTVVLTLTGQAVDAQGHPVTEAEVTAWTRPMQFPFRDTKVAGDGNARVIRTDEAGRFSFEITVPVNNMVGVLCETEGCVPGWSGWKYARDFQSDMIGTLRLRRLRTVSGRVVDRQGRPIEHMEVFQSGDGPQITSTRTDMDGRYRLDGAPEGPAFVFARQPGFRFRGRDVGEASDGIDLTLIRDSEPVEPRHTLPPPVSDDEALRLCRELCSGEWDRVVRGGKQTLQDRHQMAHYYAWVEPWRVVSESEDFVRHWIAPALYRSDPDEALAELATISQPHLRALAHLWLEPHLSRSDIAGRKELLSRALSHGRQTDEPENRIYTLSTAAVRLFDLGDHTKARGLVAEMQAIGGDVSSDHARGQFAEAVGLFEPEHALALLDKIDHELSRVRFCHRLAYHYARRDPPRAERFLVAGAQVRNPGLRFGDNRAVPACWRMSEVDALRAERIARSMQMPEYRAYTLGLLAQRAAPSDRERAVRLLDEAFSELVRYQQTPDERRQQWMSRAASIVAAGLLPVVEQLTPDRVEERLWQAVALRDPANSRSSLARFDEDLGQTAALMARYDRRVAAQILAPLLENLPQKLVSADDSDAGAALAVIDPVRGTEYLKTFANTETGGWPLRKQVEVLCFVRVLARPDDLRRRYVYSLYELWLPEHEELHEFVAW